MLNRILNTIIFEQYYYLGILAPQRRIPTYASIHHSCFMPQQNLETRPAAFHAVKSNLFYAPTPASPSSTMIFLTLTP